MAGSRLVVAVMLTIGLLAAPVASEAQQPAKSPRIGLLSPFSVSEAAPWHEAFRQGLRELGWVEGKNVTIEYRYAEGRTERLPDLAADLVRLNVDIIVTSVGTDARVAARATRTIPIVMAAGGDPVAGGMAANLARPGGDITGLTQMAVELAAKRLQLLKEIVPTLTRVAVLWRSAGAETSRVVWTESQGPARALGLQLYSMEIRDGDEFDAAFARATRERVGALVVTPNPLFVRNLKRIAVLAAKSRLATVFHLREFADVGGLMAYGPDRSDMFRRAATYVDKILKGAKPGELPIEQPTKFELVINLKTAKALGLTIPQSILMRADETIE